MSIHIGHVTDRKTVKVLKIKFSRYRTILKSDFPYIFTSFSTYQMHFRFLTVQKKIIQKYFSYLLCYGLKFLAFSKLYNRCIGLINPRFKIPR